MRKLAHLGAPVVLTLIFWGCAPTARDPFATGGRQASSSEHSHSVRFQASCDACVVSWSVAHLSGSRQDSALFSQGVRIALRPGEATTAQLRASPIRGDVRWIQIHFDGELVAEARPGGTGSMSGTLSVSGSLQGQDSSPDRKGAAAEAGDDPEGTPGRITPPR